MRFWPNCYVLTSSINVSTRQNGKNGEASHDCDQCKYKAKRKGLLKKHIKSIHGNDKYDFYLILSPNNYEFPSI